MPTAEEFREQLFEVFRRAEQKRQSSVVVKAGDLHRAIGGYPSRNTQRMPVCCSVMRGAMHAGDVIVSEPPKGQGATLTIRYELPRPGPGGTA
jgi:5-methylcytosine-specific restriction protein A